MSKERGESLGGHLQAKTQQHRTSGTSIKHSQPNVENILTERCDEVVEKLAADLRVLASNYFMRVALDKHEALLRQFDKQIGRAHV